LCTIGGVVFFLEQIENAGPLESLIMKRPISCFRSCPVELGSHLRVPHFAWPLWGITWSSHREFNDLVGQSEKAYRSEWDGTTVRNHEEIAQASRVAGLKDANGKLNEKVAEVALSVIASHRSEQINILDVGTGSGATALAVWSQLCDEARRRTRWVFLDPAKQALMEAKQAALTAGLAAHQLDLLPSRDLDAFPYLSDKFDVVLAVASIHHHAYLPPVLSGLAQCLKPEGFLIVGDWFNGLSLHPARVLALLEKMKWKDREEYLEAFMEQFPASTNDIEEEVSDEDRCADEQIAAFWLAYSNIVGSAAHPLRVLEGHRRIEHYIGGLRKAGLHTPARLTSQNIGNPHFLIPNSSLLAVLTAIK
jgi:SAM-dependent methyltransferase